MPFDTKILFDTMRHRKVIVDCLDDKVDERWLINNIISFIEYEHKCKECGYEFGDFKFEKCLRCRHYVPDSD